MKPTSKLKDIKDKLKAGKVSDTLIQALLNAQETSFTRIDQNLYFRVTNAGSGFWVYQYKINNKPKRMTLGKYGKRPDGMPLVDARTALAEARATVIKGKDPLVERHRAQRSEFKTVDDLAKHWLENKKGGLTHPGIPQRIYQQEIKPKLGKLPLNDVSGLDIQETLKFVKHRKKTPRLTIVNDTLILLKQLFDYGVKMSASKYNAASAFKTEDAGGTEKSRTRSPTIDEWKIIFSVMRKNEAHFCRENYLAMALLLVLGVRKGELISLRWDEMDFEKKVWYLSAEKAKNSYALDIPLPSLVIEWLDELKIRAHKSEYVFPSRRASKRREYISDDTLNHALTNLFGKKTGKLKSSTGNVLGEAGIEYFVIHDTRRSTRTIMSKNKVLKEVAEKAINHVKKGVEDIYNRDTFFEERIEAHDIIANLVREIV